MTTASLLLYSFSTFRCVPFASPAHENREHGSILLHNYYYDTDLSARRVINILLLLFTRLCLHSFYFYFYFS
jgi:hypothetical protein